MLATSILTSSFPRLAFACCWSTRATNCFACVNLRLPNVVSISRGTVNTIDIITSKKKWAKGRVDTHTHLLESMICTTLCCEATCIEFTMAADCMLPDSICLVFLSRSIQNFMYEVDLYSNPSFLVQHSSKHSCGSMWYLVVLRSSSSVWWKASLCGANIVRLVWFCK